MKKILPFLIALITISISSQEIKFGKVSKAELEEKFYPLDSTADAAYLFLERKTYYTYNQNKGFEVVTEVHKRIKFYNKEGFDKANQSIIYYKPESGNNERITSVKGYTFNIENGKVSKQKLSKSSIFDEKRSKYRSVKKISFPNIKEGAVVDFVYKKTSPYRTYIDDVNYQFDIPVKSFFCSIERPEYYNFKAKNKGYFLIPVKTTSRNGSLSFSQRIRTTNRNISGTNTYSDVSYSSRNLSYNKDIYQSINIPALKNSESFVTDIKNYRGGVKYELSSINFPDTPIKTYSNSWENVVKQIYNSPNFGGELNKTSYYEKDLLAITTDAKNDFEKSFKILQFVKQKIKWNGYTGKYVEKGVRKAYKEGTGNIAEINLMLTSMLRFSGLNAYPVLVSTRKNGVPLFPTLDGFNYVVAMVKFPENKYILLDASEMYSSPNVLPLRALNWNGRVVAKNGGSSWVKLTPSKHATEDHTVMAKITEDLTVEGLIRTKLLNHNALTYRIRYNNVVPETLKSNFEEKYNLEVDNFKVSNEYKLGKPVNRDVKFTSEDLIEEINGKLYLEPLLFLTIRENIFKLEERKFPVDFASPWKEKNTVSIQIPEGYKVESLPEVLAIGLPEKMGFFKFQVSQVGNKIKVMSILQFNTPFISPDYYKPLKEFYGKLVEKQTEKIVLIKQ